MGYFIALIISAIIGVASPVKQLDKTATNQPVNTSPPAVCLEESVAQNGIDPGLARVPKILKNIKKPTHDNLTRGYEIPQCQNMGSCDGPPTSDYILVATNVRADYVVFPNNFEEDLAISDRQLVKQIDFTNDPIVSDRYKNRLYRTFCGDWCSTCNPEDVVCLDGECLKGECKTDKPPVTLPYRGTYHCDFIFYLQDSDDAGNLQLGELGDFVPGRQNDKLPELPANKSYFSIYFRKGATIPEALKCPFQKQGNVQGVQTEQLSAQSLSGDIIKYPDTGENYWKLEKNPAVVGGSYTARNTQIINYARLGTLGSPAGLSGEFEVYKNLLEPESTDLLYLVKPGTVNYALEKLSGKPPQISTFSYFLLRAIVLKSAAQKSVKLGTFLPSSDWIKKWAQESKPAIYLYPEKVSRVTVKLHPSGYLTITDPPYDLQNGWQIIAYPNGNIQSTIHYPSSNIYPYLYYEAQVDKIPVVKSGFVVPKKELTEFLQDKLKYLGLNDKEITDYLDYWLPRLENQEENYFLVYFLSNDQIETLEPIDINISINTSIRIRTYFKPLQNPIDVPSQILEKPAVRTGNILVEWGGILDTN